MTSKKLKSILRRREFWFVVLVYPAMAICARMLTSALMPIATKYPMQYGMVTFTLSIIIIGCTVLEIISRLMKHELQGEKLKIREREGIRIEEHNV